MTTQTRFTPGKWKSADGFPCFVETESSLPLAVTHPHHIAHREAVDGVDCPELDECIANGILIAAAPRLYAALEAQTEWHSWSLEYSERAAEEFRTETGFMAPFKDRSPIANNADDRAEAHEAWRVWCAKKRDAIAAEAWAALAQARGEP